MGAPPRRSIVRRLAATVAAATALVLVVLVVATYLLAGRQLAAQLDDRLAEQATALAADVDAEDAADPVELADDLFGEAGATTFDAQVLRGDGSLLVSSGAVPGGTPLVDAATVAAVEPTTVGRGTVAAGDQLLRVHLRGMPGTSLVLVVASDLTPVTEPRQALLSVLVPVGLVGVVGLAATAWAVLRRSLRPLADMASRAGTIGANDLGTRLPRAGTDDEVDRMGATINGMLDRLEAQIERERRFAADASHELRTPLAILRAELELAETTADEVTGRRLVSAREEIDRLAGLIDDLLVLARADAERLDSQEAVDLGDLIAEIADRFRSVAQQRGVAVTVRGAATVEGDRRGLDRAVSNLIDNALRHTPTGGQVEVDTVTEEGGLRVTVVDTGPGVATERLPELFERFSRTDAARTSGGAGLGLAIVAAVVEAHRGEVTATNGPSGGLRIEILLPRPRT